MWLNQVLLSTEYSMKIHQVWGNDIHQEVLSCFHTHFFLFVCLFGNIKSCPNFSDWCVQSIVSILVLYSLHLTRVCMSLYVSKVTVFSTQLLWGTSLTPQVSQSLHSGPWQLYRLRYVLITLADVKCQQTTEPYAVCRHWNSSGWLSTEFEASMFEPNFQEIYGYLSDTCSFSP